ncbi:MAG TPA: four helix bundle protein [Candidatus Saccharimonadales bacterium]|nr:four helix bundle protein [Candidatus Saccharimonadales bacterium]
MDSRNFENGKYKPIKSFQDLVVYQNLYRAMVIVLTQIIPFLPNEEKFDLVDQMRRACKAGPALIAEGFAKRYQIRQWRKYLNDTIGESNEMVHHLSVCIDIYKKYIDVKLCKEVIEIYDTTCKQLTKLGQAWQDYHANDK